DAVRGLELTLMEGARIFWQLPEDVAGLPRPGRILVNVVRGRYWQRHGSEAADVRRIVDGGAVRGCEGVVEEERLSRPRGASNERDGLTAEHTRRVVTRLGTVLDVEPIALGAVVVEGSRVQREPTI